MSADVVPTSNLTAQVALARRAQNGSSLRTTSSTPRLPATSATNASARCSPIGRWAARAAKLERLPQVVEDAPPDRDGLHDGSERVVLENERRGLSRDVRPALSHRDADVGGVERWRVVHAVAGHRDDEPAPPEELYDAQLVRWPCDG